MLTQFGKVQSQIDNKNRIRLPAKFRAQFGDKYILLPGTDGCIWLFREDDDQTTVLQQLKNLESLNPALQKKMRILSSLGANRECDDQGRFSLTADLIKLAAISNDIYFIGNNSKIEIWAVERWEAKYGEALTPDFIDSIYSSFASDDTK